MTVEECNAKIKDLLVVLKNYRPEFEWVVTTHSTDPANCIGYVANNHIEFVLNYPDKLSLYFKRNNIRLSWTENGTTYDYHEDPIKLLHKAKEKVNDEIFELKLIEVNI